MADLKKALDDYDELVTERAKLQLCNFCMKLKPKGDFDQTEVSTTPYYCCCDCAEVMYLVCLMANNGRGKSDITIDISDKP